MIDILKGRYWDEGVKLVSGCTRCSDGCKNCWSLAMEYRFTGTHDKYGNIKALPANEIEVYPDRLKRFNTRKPKVFALWNDLFHEDVPDEFILNSYTQMMRYNQNTYLILTKRQSRMLSLILTMRDILKKQGVVSPETFPEYHIYHGLTVCNQQEADEKIPIFLQVPGKKFLSIEPCLGNISLWDTYLNIKWVEYFDVVIMGAETGAGARPMDVEWVETIMDECEVAGTPFFLKQLDKKHNRILDGVTHDALPWVK